MATILDRGELSRSSSLISFPGVTSLMDTLVKIDQPAQTRQAARQGPSSILDRGTHPHFKIASGSLQILCFISSTDIVSYTLLHIEVFIVFIFALSKSPQNFGPWTNLFSGESVSVPSPQNEWSEMPPTDTPHTSPTRLGHPHCTWSVCVFGRAGEMRCRDDQCWECCSHG